MKTLTQPMRNAECSTRNGNRRDSGGAGFCPPPAARRVGFTLIELLTVIAIIAVIAAMIFPVLTAVKKHQYVNTAKAELDQIASALDDYKNKYGSYPPSNPKLSPAINTLYYELSGVTETGGKFTTLDGSCQINQSDYATAFTAVGASIGGIINCTKGTAEEGTAARNFLPSLRANRLGTGNKAITSNIPITNLVTSVRGPDASYAPLGTPDVNPFWYAYPGTNNPNGYDLWIDLRISGKTNRICNWRSTPYTL